MQQVAQVSGLLAMLVVITLLARRLSLAELGVYGLLTSLAGYLLVVQNAAANAAVRSMAAATDAAARARSFSTAAAVFAGTGLLTGALVAAIGVGLALVVGPAPALEREAIAGALLLGAVTAIGWPLTIYRDALRAARRFVLAATMDIVSLGAYAALMLALILSDVDLRVLIAASGSIPLFAGLASMLAVRGLRLDYRLSLRAVHRREAGELGSLAAYISATEAAGVVIYALDRAILGVFYSAAVVGLYEGPVRAHNLLRALNGALGVTGLPTAAGYFAVGDRRRLAELLVRGTRYALALMVPLTVTGMVLAGPILDIWLGERYTEGALAMTILLAYWLGTASVGVGAAIVVAGGGARKLALYAWAVAIGNLGLTLALVPAIGLEGAALGTTVPYLLILPFQWRLILSYVDVPLVRLARTAWIPAYAAGAALAAGLVTARVALEPSSLLAVAALATGAVVVYWALYYLIVLTEDERELVRSLFRRGTSAPARG